MNVDEFLKMYNEYKTSKIAFDRVSKVYNDIEIISNELTERLDLNFQKNINLNDTDKLILADNMVTVNVSMNVGKNRKKIMTARGNTMNKKLKDMLHAVTTPENYAQN